MKKEDKIDNLAGIVLNKKIGDRVDTGDILAYIHTNKEENKKALCEKFGLKYNPERPLYAMVSRLVGQKGIDLIRQVEGELKNLDADFIFLGSGDKDYENLLIWLSNNSSNIRAYIGYCAELANLIYAGSDFYLMPSKFEPCGLSQLIAMRYGTLPVVRATGGLEDTVVGYPLADSTGFKFWGYDGWSMLDAIRCSIDVYKDKYTFHFYQFVYVYKKQNL